MRRSVDSVDEFFEEYVFTGFFIGLVLTMISFLIGAEVWDNLIKNEQKLSNIYAMLQGNYGYVGICENVHEVAKTLPQKGSLPLKKEKIPYLNADLARLCKAFKDSEAEYFKEMKVAKAVRELATSDLKSIGSKETKLMREDRNVFQALLGDTSILGKMHVDVDESVDRIKQVVRDDKIPVLKNLIFLSKTSYLNVFLENKKQIESVVKGGEIPSVPISKEVDFLMIAGIISWLLVALCTTSQFVFVSIDYSESLLEWPWDEIWVYPIILVMSPVLVPCMIAEVLNHLYRNYVSFGHTRRTLIVLYRMLRTYIMRAKQLMPSKVQTCFSPTLSSHDKTKDEHLTTAEAEVLRQIEEARSNLEKSRESFIKMNLIDIDHKRGELQRSVNVNRGILSTLGGEIQNCQRGLAASQQNLDLFEEQLPELLEKKRDWYLREFDNILQLSEVRAVQVKDQKLHVYTDTIYIEKALRKFKIGDIIIVIDMPSKTVTLKNLTSTHPYGYCHPYAKSESFCWGSMDKFIGNALDNGEYAVALSFIFKALKSAEGDNPSAVKEWLEVF